MRTCPSCSADNADSSEACVRCGTALAPEFESTRNLEGAVAAIFDDAKSGGSSVPSAISDTSLHGRFLPGQLLANRYRIVSLIKAGGMGEVYRADDLTLQQPVALKFLKSLGDDPRLLDYLHSEVRLSRQIAHPNVCRVYDVGEVDGLHFLSMEFIDGEDLRALLRRIGTLPEAKAVEIAQQLCAGIGAAHDRGVLHRDLKPANVMIDGRGQVRITDFGLARLAADDPSGDVVGTPRYMAPEQLLQGSATVQSDLYAIGLMIFEIFTGNSPTKSFGLNELIKFYSDPTNQLPVDELDAVDPAVRRAVLQCLQWEPHERPSSAYVVASALPGGDPLMAAMRAGETPSPGIVAAAGGTGGISLSTGGTCLGLCLAGLLAAVFLLPSTTLVGRVSPPLSTDVLVHKSRETLRTLGHADARYAAYGYEHDEDFLNWVAETEGTADQWDVLGHDGTPALFFWYRQSPAPIVPALSYPYPADLEMGRASWSRPVMQRPGTAAVKLDLRGRLVEYRAIVLRDQFASVLSLGTPNGNWDVFFNAAGLKPSKFKLVAKGTSFFPFPTDETATWSGTHPSDPDIPVTIEAGSLRGQPVYFRIRTPWTPPSDASRAEVMVAPNQTGRAVTFVLLLLTAFVLAPRNVRIGRADRRGAFRLACFVFGLMMLVWLFETWHVLHVVQLRQFILGLACALYWGALCWIAYLALEPYARKLWPQILISWSRLQAGRFRDPRVGRDMLFGALAGVAYAFLEGTGRVVPTWVGVEAPVPYWHGWVPATLVSGFWTGNLVFNLVYSIRNVLFFWLLFLLVFRAIFRKPLPAAVALGATLTILAGPLAGFPAASWPFIAAAQALGIFVLVRLGIVAAIAMVFANVMLYFPVTADLSAWYFGRGMLALGVIASIAVIGFLNATRDTVRPATGP